MEKNLQAVQYTLPRLAKEGVSKIVIEESGAAKYIYKTKRKKANEWVIVLETLEKLEV